MNTNGIRCTTCCIDRAELIKRHTFGCVANRKGISTRYVPGFTIAFNRIGGPVPRNVPNALELLNKVDAPSLTQLATGDITGDILIINR
ncbi:Uncharacterised protein [BD1-7 clade bacterium]|nr:Uncharacterised protein [BD1-7 clade bacterium]